MSEEREEQKTFKLILDLIIQKEKENKPFSISNILMTIRDLKNRGVSNTYKEIDLDDASEILQNLYLDGWFRPDWNQNESIWLILSSYGKSQLDLEYPPVFLDPVQTIKDLKTSIPNIDSIALDYYTESLWAIKKRLYLSATVTMGCASERLILLLIEALIEYNNNHEPEFVKCHGIKNKFDFLFKTVKDKGFKKKLLLIYQSDKDNIDDINRLFIDIDTIFNQMFQIYRINRNESGHPTGTKFDDTTVKATAAMFKRYCEIVYGLISYLKQNQ